MADSTSLAPAVIGLVGVLVGGIIAAGTNYIVAIRKERADRAKEDNDRKLELNRAARMVWVELRVGSDALHLARTNLRWVPQDTGANVLSDSWDKYGAILAAAMPFEDWENVAAAYAGIHTLRSWYHKEKDVEFPKTHVTNFDTVIDNVEQAISSLQRYLGPADKPRHSRKLVGTVAM
jgi:hypothetical protein